MPRCSSTEGTGWRLELGDPVAVGCSPVGQTTEKQPQIRFSVEANAAVEEAGLWLDGGRCATRTARGPAGADRRDAGRPLAPGRHVIVVFGRSGSNAAAASPFVIERGPSA